MPKKQPSISTGLDLSHLSKAVKALQDLPTPPSNSEGEVIVNVSQSSVGGSGMKKVKVKKAEPTAAEKIEKAIATAVDLAVTQINRKLIAKVVVERVRQKINSRFHGSLSPADVDRFSKDAARSVTYELNNLKELPAGFLPMASSEPSGESTHTAEPEDEDGDF